MKIAITSDHHYWNYTEFATSSHNGITSRFQEMLDVEDWLIEYMMKNSIDYHVRLGDLFDRKNIVDSIVYHEIARRIQTVTDIGIEQIILKGNHDDAGGGNRSTIETLRFNGAHIIGATDRVCIDNTWFHFAAYDVHNKYVLSVVNEVEASYRSTPNVLCCHVEVHGAKTSTEYRLKSSLYVEDLKPELFMHILSGHLHTPQTVGALEYVGSFCQRNFSDAGPHRSFIVYDTTNDTYERVPLPGPIFQSLTIETIEDLPVPNPSTYYSVLRKTPSIPAQAIHEWGDKNCRGVKVLPIAPSKKPRIDIHNTQDVEECTLPKLLKIWCELNNYTDTEALVKNGVELYNG